MKYFKNGSSFIQTIGTIDLPEITKEEFDAKQAEVTAAVAAYAPIAEASRPLAPDEALTLIIKKQVNSLSISDATASRMVDYYPTLTGDGSLIKAGTKINWNGVLKKAAVDLWDTAENNPDAAPTLWSDISYRDGIRIAPETFTATNAAAMDELMWFGDRIYKSKMAGNVYTPEQAPTAWELIR